MWETLAVWNSNASGNNLSVLSGRLLSATSDPIGELSKLPEDWEAAPQVSLNDSDYYVPWIRTFRFAGQLSSPELKMPRDVFLHHSGRFYTYDSAAVNSSFACITPEGVFDAWETPDGHFRSAYMLHTSPIAGSGHEMLIADLDGIYHITFASKSVSKIVDGPIAKAGFLEDEEGQPEQLWAFSDSNLSLYRLKAGDNLPMMAEPAGRWTTSFAKSLYPVRVSQAADGSVAISEREGPRFLVATFKVLNRDGSLREVGRVKVHEDLYVQSGERELMLFPPALMFGTTVISALFVGDIPTLADPFSIVVTLHALIAMAVVYWISRKRKHPKRKLLAWTIAGACGGIGAVIAILAIDRKPVYETCVDCEQPRRVDLPRCENCNSPWEAPESDGNEIIEQWQDVIPENGQASTSV